MTEIREMIDRNAEQERAEERETRRLLNSAGPRPAVPAADLAAIRSAARIEWKKAVVAAEERPPARRYVEPLALAASLLLVFAVAWWWQRQAVPVAGDLVATVELVRGEVRSEGRVPALGASLLAGTELSTGKAAAGEAPALALRWASGHSVRLDASTRVRLASNDRLELVKGAVYVDSGAMASGSLEIGTSFGSVREIGTQFEVRLVEGESAPLRVRVREGAVSLVREVGTHSVAMGEELRLRRDGTLEWERVATSGPDWDWVLGAAPGFDIEGESLDTFLAWVARETGWRVRYEDASLAQRVETIELYGSIEGLAPDESVSVILPSSGLGYRLENGTLVVTGPAELETESGARTRS